MISSTANEKVKRVAALMTKARRREEEDVYLVEGVRLYAELPEEETRELYLTQAGEEELRRRGLGERIGRLRERGIVEEVSDHVLAKMSDVVTPQGVLAVAARRHITLTEAIAGKASPLLLLLEDIRDPGNLGTILRTAEAAGADAVLLAGDCAELYSPKVVRATMGAIFRLPVAEVGAAAECCRTLREQGIQSYAAALDADAAPYTEAAYRGGAALIIGNEAKGLRAETIAAAGERVYIPMAGKTESLNASVSAAVLLYEAARQRGRFVDRKKRQI